MAAPGVGDPILNWNVQLADPTGRAEPGSEPWRSVGQHEVWVGRYPAAHPPLHVQEMHQRRCVEFAKPGYCMHRVAAGTPYRVSHLFGFWHVSDADLNWLQFERSGLTFYVALAGGSTGLPGDQAIAWYCARCGEQINRQEFGRAGRAGRFLARGCQPAIEVFNATTDKRRCRACHWEHPPAYPFSPHDPRAPAGAIPPW
jgi:hypothetical protein